MKKEDLHALKRQEALELLQGGHWGKGSDQDRKAQELLPQLRKLREFELLAQLAERLARLHPKEPGIRRHHAQALIELGQLTAAIEVARAGLKGLSVGQPEWSELTGLLGRAYKQMVVDAHAMGSESLAALKLSLQSYAKPYRHDKGNTWHAVNLVAVSAFAKRLGLKVAVDLDAEKIAREVLEILGNKPDPDDPWYEATLAEVFLALDDLQGVEEHLRAFLSHPKTGAFEVASTLRQFRQIWELEASKDPRRRGIVQAMYARLIELPGADIDLSSKELNRQLSQTSATQKQMESILGLRGPVAFGWWKLGLEQASAVGAVYSLPDSRLGTPGERIGTSFLVRSTDIRPGLEEELLLLTNYHVINPDASGGALRPADAEVVFEAAAPEIRYTLQNIVWSSPVDQHDACLLRLKTQPDIKPLQLAKYLPAVTQDENDRSSVYVIGYPAGGGLKFSFQDNDLLDHEGNTGARPCRVHYRAPTEKGNSGSPVFNNSKWEVIALHHAGGILSRLNEKAGTYPANEGISIHSIVAALNQP